MAVEVDVKPSALEVRFTGMSAVWALRRSVRLPWRQITEVAAVPVKQAKTALGWRLGGTAVPGVIVAGNYTVKGRKGERALWYVRRADEVLEVTTTRAKPRHIVVEVDDPEAVAAEIRGHLVR